MRSAFDVQHGEVDVAIMDAKGSPPGAGKPEAEPCGVVYFIVVAAVSSVVALQSVCSSILVCWE